MFVFKVPLCNLASVKTNKQQKKKVREEGPIRF